MFDGQIVNPLNAGDLIEITEVLVGGKLEQLKAVLRGKNNCTPEQKVGVWTSVLLSVRLCVFVCVLTALPSRRAPCSMGRSSTRSMPGT